MPPRILAGIPSGDPQVFSRLLGCLEPPFHLLYVLHTPRGEGEPGRYQSPLLGTPQVLEFLDTFRDFLAGDSRFELWAHSPSSDGTIVWDRHNRLHAYGPLARYRQELLALGYAHGPINLPDPHEHYYRSEFDPAARGILEAFDWRRSPLQPEDEQFRQSQS